MSNTEHNGAVTTVDLEVAAEAPIFVLASGQRCGSTLLQRLLNSNPHVMIWGEQGGYLERFLLEHQSLLSWAERHGELRAYFERDGYDHFLPNMLPDVQALQRAAGTYLAALFAAPARQVGRPFWGLKEVRYDAYVASLLLNCFPKARIVHITRNVWDCYRSLKRWETVEGRWSRDWTKMALDDWVRVNASFIESRDRLRNLLSVRYEAMIADPGGFLVQLAGFLDMDPAVFDGSVFERRVAETPDEPALPTLNLADVELDQTDLEWLGTEPVQKVARALGYAPPAWCGAAAR